MSSRASSRLSLLLAVALAAVLLSVVPSSGPARAATVAATDACDGVDYADVMGPRPSYGAKDLRTYPVRSITCRAYFLPKMNGGFVPQGVAVNGNDVWVSGYTYAEKVGDQACRLVRVDKRDGTVLTNIARLTGAAGTSKPTFCRHGGGLAYYGQRLWISERERLWLIDPSRIGKGNPVVRMWRIAPPAYGSSVVIKDGRVGLVQFSRGDFGVIAWVDRADLFRRGVTDIGAKGTATQAGTTRTRTVPYAQGSTPYQDGLLVTRTWTGCGQIARADGTLTGAIPAIQAIQRVGSDRTWLVSEASAKPYTTNSRALVPMVSEIDTGAALALTGQGSCP